MNIEIEEIRKVNLSDGDVVVVRFDCILTHEQRQSFINSIDGVFPDNKVLALDGGASIDVLSKKNIEDMR